MKQKCLTIPSEVCKNGSDNMEGNLVVYEDDIIFFRNERYKVISYLGKGSYGQVFKCMELATKKFFAIKISKGDLLFSRPSIKEASFLYKFNSINDSSIVRIKNDFDFKGHHCLVLELLSYNLFDFIKMNGFTGISHKNFKKIIRQCLRSLSILHSQQIIHSDIKPENILLVNENFDVKIIDLGASLYSNDKIRGDFYIQSRYYRAPEVLKKQHFSTMIDIWSLGCVLYELFMGKPLFPGENNTDQLERICYFFNNNIIRTRMTDSPSINEEKMEKKTNDLPNYKRKNTVNSNENKTKTSQKNQTTLANLPEYKRKQSLLVKNNDPFKEDIPDKNESCFYEISEDYKLGDKIIKNKTRISFEENVKRNYLRKEDCIQLVLMKGPREDSSDFLDLLFKMVEAEPLLRFKAEELLDHKYLVDEYTPYGMVITTEENEVLESNRSENPPPKKDYKTFSSGFSFSNDNSKSRRWTYYEKKKEK